MIIYLTTNNIKGKVYVGKLVDESKSTYLGSGTCVGRAIKQYGKENFSRITLEGGITDHDYLCKREIYWIEFYDSTNPEIGYNLSEGGRGGYSGCKHTPETLEKMSEAQKGENHPMYGKRGKETGMFGKHHTEEARKKMSEANKGKNHPMYGKHHTEEACKNMSKSARNRPPASEETCKKISESKRGINNPNVLEKGMVLNVLKLLKDNVSMKNITKELKVCNRTIHKVKNGGYDDIYDL